MIFKYIKLREANDERLITFSDKNNHVFSAENSKGKTTLLRLLLYSLGYNIPGTKNLDFDKCDVEALVQISSGELITLLREARSYIICKTQGDEKTYALPGQEYELHSMLFGVSNSNLLRNILGVFYFDQERGWGMLNKGSVIGSNSYNVDELMMGINDIDCSNLLSQRKQLNRDLTKYKQMYSVSLYKETLDRKSNNLVSEPYDSEVENEINQCQIRLAALRKELARIDRVQKENESLKKHIDEMGIMVRISEDDIITLTSDRIVSLDDTIDYLKAKRQLISSEYNQVKTELSTYINKIERENQQLSFFEDERTIMDIFDNQIARLPLDPAKVKHKIDGTKKEISKLSEKIKELMKTGSRVTMESIFERAKEYLDEMGLDGDDITKKYLFKGSTRGLSGAILHMTVFAMRLACLVEVQKYIKYTLPIILDSPRGKEIDNENVAKMYEILNRDFTANQIIVASIYSCDLENLNKIELKNRLIE